MAHYEEESSTCTSGQNKPDSVTLQGKDASCSVDVKLEVRLPLLITQAMKQSQPRQPLLMHTFHLD